MDWQTAIRPPEGHTSRFTQRDRKTGCMERSGQASGRQLDEIPAVWSCKRDSGTPCRPHVTDNAASTHLFYRCASLRDVDRGQTGTDMGQNDLRRPATGFPEEHNAWSLLFVDAQSMNAHVIKLRRTRTAVKKIRPDAASCHAKPPSCLARPAQPSAPRAAARPPQQEVHNGEKAGEAERCGKNAGSPGAAMRRIPLIPHSLFRPRLHGSSLDSVGHSLLQAEQRRRQETGADGGGRTAGAGGGGKNGLREWRREPPCRPGLA